MKVEEYGKKIIFVGIGAHNTSTNTRSANISENIYTEAGAEAAIFVYYFDDSFRSFFFSHVFIRSLCGSGKAIGWLHCIYYT